MQNNRDKMSRTSIQLRLGQSRQGILSFAPEIGRSPLQAAAPAYLLAARYHRISILLLSIALLTQTFGCDIRKRMYDQPRVEPLEKSDFFADGRAARHPVAGTVARGQLKEDEHLHVGRVDGAFAETFPMEVTKTVIKRGQNRFNIYCSVCHDRAGTGRGMVVKRGYKQPPSMHLDRLKESAPGYYFHVMTQGFGVMPSYRYQLSPEDRWAVVAYIRALQLSQGAKLSDVPEKERASLRSELHP